MNLSRTKIEPDLKLIRTLNGARKKPEDRPDVEVSFDIDDAIQKVGRPICSEKWKDKEAVIARKMQEQGFSQSQIAEYLECSRSTVKRRLRRLRPKYSWELD
ncbi:MAG: HTH domain-containing protein [Candidatus Thorarchaeota archaeon]|jgi:DNA invertase Pin-like site-specific DNA recombinase